MIFLRRETLKEYLKLYPVNSLILAIILIVFLLTELGGGSTNTATLLHYGAIYKVPGESPELWRYLTAIFLHAGWQHLLFNGFAIYVFASPLERLLGHTRYAVFFLISGIAGNLASQLLQTEPYLGVGASGAIYGVYAAYLYLGLFRKEVLDAQSRQTVSTILIMGLIYSLIVPHINLYAHLGGFIGGFLYFVLLTKRYNRR